MLDACHFRHLLLTQTLQLVCNLMLSSADRAEMQSMVEVIVPAGTFDHSGAGYGNAFQLEACSCKRMNKTLAHQEVYIGFV